MVPEGTVATVNSRYSTAPVNDGFSVNLTLSPTRIGIGPLMLSLLPQTKVFVIGVKPSLARHHLRGKQLILNKFISELANEEENLTFIDVWQEMLLENNEANPELFVEDGLHMNSKGYEIWTKLVKSYLESTFEPDKS